MRDWLLDCWHCQPVRLGVNEGPIIGLECAKDGHACKRKPGMSPEKFDSNGICSLYEESYPCEPDGTTIPEEE